MAPNHMPSAAFASDNAAPAHPAALDALVTANSGNVASYGEDSLTECYEMGVAIAEKLIQENN